MATATQPKPYRSGWCGTGDHHRCAGSYGAPCTCLCHDKREAARLRLAERMKTDWATAK